MRRRPGLGALQSRAADEHAAQRVGASLSASAAAHTEAQLAAFRVHLDGFARKHRAEINADPAFRAAFARMARSVGVDPLASSKGFWAEALGSGDWFYELAVQVVDVCIATRKENGGLIALDELAARVARMRGGSDARGISLDDVLRAVESLAVLGGGYRTVALPGGRVYLLSVPVEMNADRTTVLAKLAAGSGAGGGSGSSGGGGGSGGGAAGAFACVHATAEGLRAALGWEPARVRAALNELLKDGLAWIDTQAADGPCFYFPAIRA